MMVNIGMLPFVNDVQPAAPPLQSSAKENSGAVKDKDGFSGALDSALKSGGKDQPVKPLAKAKDAGNDDKVSDAIDSGVNLLAACAAVVQPEKNTAAITGQQGSAEELKVNTIAGINANRQLSVFPAGIPPTTQLNITAAIVPTGEQGQQTSATDVNIDLEQESGEKPQLTLPTATGRLSAATLNQPAGSAPNNLRVIDGGKIVTENPGTDKDALDAKAIPADKPVSLTLTSQPKSENKVQDQPLAALSSLLGVKVEVVKASPTASASAISPKIALQASAQPELNQISQSAPLTSDTNTAEPAAMPQKEVTPTAAKNQADSGLDNSSMLSGEQVDGKSALKQDEIPVSSQQSFAATLNQHVLKNDNPSALQDATNIKASDPYNIAGQIVDQAKIVSTPQNSEMIIKLKPEHLGELTLKVAVDNGTVSATFHSSNPEVRGIIENSLGQLRQEIANQGLKVNYVGVYASLDHFSAKDQRGHQQQQMTKTKTKAANQEFVEAVESLSANYQSVGTGGVDYRI